VSPLGVILVVILVIVLLGGAGPYFYQGAPWRPGYGLGGSLNGVLGLVLIVVVVLWLMGRL
jgi:hypothetical protein